jgi:predicted DsbA family dithiol-disulfide isomerase
MPDADRTLAEITYYTDPLCCWSWALEPEWRKLLSAYGAWLRWRYRMGGLIADWSSYADPLNNVNRAAQMGPLWLQAAQSTGVPIDAGIWHDDPPESSYPACLAVKAAEQQGQAVGEAFLRRAREAVMLERRNIGRVGVLVELAREIAEVPGFAVAFDPVRFQTNLDNPTVLEAFRDDLTDVRYRGIGRLPTLIIRPVEGRSVMVVGYRPFELLRDALLWAVPDLPEATVDAPGSP